MSAYVKAELAATCSSLGRMHNGKYIIDDQCYLSIRDIIRYLRRDDEYHDIRRYLGDAKILQSDLIHVVANCPPESNDLFDITVRLLVNLTNPVMLLYREEVPAEKVGRNIYMNLIAHSQEYKIGFCNIEFWNVISGKLTDLFEIDWSERTEENGLQIERLLVLLRNVLQVPADVEIERRPENDITIHDKVLWALRQSQLLELLLYISSNKDEEQYYLHLLEIFSLILREQNPKLLARCEIRRSNIEKEKDTMDLIQVREREKLNQNKFKNVRNFNTTFVLKNVKSISDNDVIYHKSLDKLNDLKLTQDKKRVKTPKNRFPAESERVERRSTFSVRLFLKEFCIELLNCSYNNLMNVVKDRLVAGKGLSNDEYYYFWSLKFFLEFNCTHNLDIKLISECINVQTFHFVQTQMENCFEHLVSEKKKTVIWVRRIHLILKAYNSLLQTLQWMDSSKDGSVRDTSKVIKSQIFYVVEYRELMLYILFRYDPYKFSLSYLRDLVETTHIFIKLFEDFCKQNKVVVQKKSKKKKQRKKKKDQPEVIRLSNDEKWDQIKEELEMALRNETDFPEIPPFDAASDIPVDDQKEEAMKRIQRFLHELRVRDAIGLLRSSRAVWPENGFFGTDGIDVEEELMSLQEICVTELGNEDPEIPEETNEDEMETDEEPEERFQFSEQGFDMKDFIKRLANVKVIEGCGILLKNYKKNSSYTNHCAVKLLFRVGWECFMPSMMYQASLFLTLLNIMNDKTGDYKEINKFTLHLFRKFRENAKANPKIFMELLFWKESKAAYEIENGYGTSDGPKKAASWSEEEEDELRRLWVECDNSLAVNEKVDWVKANMISDSRSRMAVMRKLKELWLIPKEARVSVKVKSVWADEEVEELKNFYEECREAVDVAAMIADRLTIKRTKIGIKRKLVELGLVSDISQLKKKRSRKSNPAQDVRSSSDEEESSDDERDEQEISSYSVEEQKTALKKVQHLRDALCWLKETIEESLEDEDDDEDEENSGYPLLALTVEQIEALENDDFLDVLRKLGLTEPGNQQIYWKIQKSKRIRLDLVKRAIEGELNNEPEMAMNSDTRDGDSIPTSQSTTRTNTQTTNNSDMSEDENNVQNTRKKNKRHAIDSDASEDEDRVIGSQSTNRSNPSNTQKSMRSDSSDDEDRATGSQSTNRSSRTNRTNTQKSMRSDSSDDESRVTSQSTNRTNTQNTINSDASEDNDEVAATKGTSRKNSKNVIDSDVSEDEDDVAKSNGNTSKTKRIIHSDGSEDEGQARSRNPSTDFLQNTVDSGDEQRENNFRFKSKRRRCIGSDSDMEESASGEDELAKPEKFLKRPKMIDSDSDFEGNNSMDDDINKAR